MQLAQLLAENNRFDLWRYQDFLGKISPDFWVSDKRAELTPLEQKTDQLWIKREDLHPIGSHKGRSIAYQLSTLRSIGAKKIVLSSSGNAAVALAQLNQFFPAFVFVSPDMDSAKKAQLAMADQTHTQIISTAFPRNFAQYLVKKYDYRDIRPSQSDEAIVGLRTLGLELAEQVSDLGSQYSIYIVTTSGANTLGMFQAFRLLQERGLLQALPKLYPVLMPGYQGGTLTTQRRQQLEEAAAHSGGTIIEHKPVLDGEQPTSFEGNTAFAAYQKHHQPDQKAIVVFTGKKWPSPTTSIHLQQCATIQALKAEYSL